MELTTVIQLVQIALVCVGGAVALVTMRNAVLGLKESLKTQGQASDKQFESVQKELKKLSEILIDQARFDEKLTSLDRRVTSQGRKIDELARGEGFIRGRRPGSIDGEYVG